MNNSRLFEWKPKAFTVENLEAVPKKELVAFLRDARATPITELRNKRRAWLIDQIIEEMTCWDCAAPIPYERSGSVCERCEAKREEEEAK